MARPDRKRRCWLEVRSLGEPDNGFYGVDLWPSMDHARFSAELSGSYFRGLDGGRTCFAFSGPRMARDDVPVYRDSLWCLGSEEEAMPIVLVEIAKIGHAFLFRWPAVEGTGEEAILRDQFPLLPIEGRNRASAGQTMILDAWDWYRPPSYPAGPDEALRRRLRLAWRYWHFRVEAFEAFPFCPGYRLFLGRVMMPCKPVKVRHEPE